MRGKEGGKDSLLGRTTGCGPEAQGALAQTEAGEGRVV